jgi:2-(1,2-epoxy-1,2-dihydrophenyl)acetyl-CoA isomerase
MTVRFERQGATAVLTLDNPAARNAFSQAVREGMSQAVATIKADSSIRAVVITGAGGHFCAGGDLGAMAGMAANMDGAAWRLRMQEAHRFVYDMIMLDRPVIAAVEGVAYGAGFSLALMADFILAAPSARFCLSFMRVGLVPDFGAAYTLPRVVSPQRAKELMLSAREVGAQEALQLGIAMELHEPAALLPRALALAHSFAGASPLATSLIKRSMHGPALAAVLEAEANAQALAFGSPQHQEARQCFLDKKPPPFQWPKA